MAKKLRDTAVSLAAMAVLTAADQWTKRLAAVHLKGRQPIVLIRNVFELSYTENRGMAFGLMQNQRWLFLVFTAAVLIGAAFLFMRMPFTRRYLPLRGTLVVFAAGAVGNMIDRTVNGYVVDFFYLRLIDFPVFNVADCYVTWTAVFAAYLLIFRYKESELSFIPGLSGRKKASE